MSDAEVDLSRMIGASAFLVYSYLRKCPRASYLDIECDLGIHKNTVTKTIRLLKDHNIIERKVIRNNVKDTLFIDENNWRIQ